MRCRAFGQPNAASWLCADDAIDAKRDMHTDHVGHGEAGHRRGVQARRKRSMTDYHPGARFDAGKAASITPSAQTGSPGIQRRCNAADRAADRGRPGGEGLSASFTSGSAAGNMSPIALSAGSADPAARVRDVRQRRHRQPNMDTDRAAASSPPHSHSTQRERSDRRCAVSDTARYRAAPAAAPAGAAQIWAHGAQSVAKKAITAGPTQPKRSCRSRTARAVLPEARRQEAGAADDGSPASAATSQVVTSPVNLGLSSVWKLT